MSEWQPIKTAPTKNKPNIFIAGYLNGWIYGPNQKPTVRWCFWGDGAWQVIGDKGVTMKQAYAWRPSLEVPAPPTPQEGDK